MTNIREADKCDSSEIASLIMEAMSADCCRYFYGENHTEEEFHRFMAYLVSKEDTQYSYQNTIVAEVDGEVAGVAVSYDGVKLHLLRRPFIDGMKSLFGRDFSSIPDETAAGELYLDSFAVKNVFRKRGIGTLLLNATFEKAKKTGIAKVGLLVDVSNPAAEHLYDSVGFCDVDGSNWGGHAMKHLQKEV